jgi:hypothetical protein
MRDRKRQFGIIFFKRDPDVRPLPVVPELAAPGVRWVTCPGTGRAVPVEVVPSPYVEQETRYCGSRAGAHRG